MKLVIKVAIQILKPVDEVFEAIVNPEKMCHYFISESSGKMEEGKKLIWKFPEFEEKVPVRIDKVEKNKFVSFFWDGEQGKETLVEMELIPQHQHATLVRIHEGRQEGNDLDVKWLSQNTEGWTNFLACLKAYLEYGINLRKGAFDYMKT
ncbi:MAG TPA: SRPBCC domain-containing protein [Flavobacteriaceae bacterium]|nr:SRPBCC domain-containing protein [Flavobacteriaceae bacterium]